MELLIPDATNPLSEYTEAIERFAEARAFQEAQEVLAELEWTFAIESNPGLHTTHSGEA